MIAKNKIFNVEVKGLKQIMKKLENLPPDIKQEAQTTVAKTAIKVHSNVIMMLQTWPKTGKIYTRGKNNSISHQASAPGEPPATDSGNLASSIKWIISSGGLSATVGIHLGDAKDTPYAARLEFGGVDSRGIYIAPRPYLQPAFEMEKEDFKKELIRVIKKAAPKKKPGRGRK